MTTKPDTGRTWIAMAFVVIASLLSGGVAAQTEPLVMKFLDKAAVSDIVPGATEYGQLRTDIPVVEALKGSEVVGYVFLTSDFVTTTGYSGKPIQVAPDIQQIRIGGSFQTHNADAFLDLLESAYGLHVERHEDMIELKR